MKTKLLFLMLIPFQMVFSQTVPVTFRYTNKKATNVYLAGNINSWSMSDANYKLTDGDGDGTFELTINLEKGSHQYKFVVDGAWIADPDNPVTDGTEYNNSLLTVSDPMVTYLLPSTSLEYKISNAPLITAVVAFGNTTTVGIGNLSLKINNTPVAISASNYNPITKIFNYQSLPGQLVEGANRVEFKITTSNGGATANRTIQASGMPVFNLLTEDMIYFKPNIVVYGKLIDFPVESVMVNLNGVSQKASINADSIFYLPVALVDGLNNVTVTVSNSNGSRTKAQTLTYQANKRPAVDVQASVAGRTVTLNANAVSPIGKTLSFVWSQPEASPSILINGDLTAGESIQLTIPPDTGEYFIRVKVTDADGNCNFGGCLIRSTIDKVSIVSPNEQPAWVKNLILYEISSYGYYRTTSPLAGIISKLDYIASLGVNAIWLTPIFEGTGNGYWTKDYYKIPSSLGTIEEFKELVTKAHSKGLKVILDLVISASWSEHPLMKNVMNLKTISPFADYYVWNGIPGASNYLHFYDWDLLPYYNLNNTELENYLYGVAEYWLREGNIDGYRCDVAWGVEMHNPNFWKEMRTRLKKINPNIFLLAESPSSNIYEGNKIDIFKNKFDAAYDWDLRGWGLTGFPAIFTGNATIDQLNSIITTQYDDNTYPMRFIDNHDHQRAALEFGIPKETLAEAIVLTANGIPLIYGGDEVGEKSQYTNTSWADPSNLIPYFQKLIEIRKKYLDNNAKVVRLTNTKPTNIYSYVAKSDTNYILTTANFSNTAQSFTINFTSPEIVEMKYKLTNIFTNAATDLSYSQLQSYSFTLNPLEAKVYILENISPHFINVSANELRILTSENSSKTVIITSNTHWTAKSNQSWLAVNLVSGAGKATLTITAGVNPTNAARTATITVSEAMPGTTVIPQIIVVTQDGIISTLTVTPSIQNVSLSSGTAIFTVVSNTAWTATSDQSWCSVTPSGSGNGTVTATYLANSERGSRTAIVTVSGSGVSSQTVSITQSGTTGIESEEISKSVNVYPNPVTDELIIEYVGNEEEADFQILNSINQVVLSGTLFYRTVVKTTNLAPGFYLVKLKSEDTFGFKKIIKN